VSPDLPDLVLASTSPYRRILLERLGLPFRCRAPLVDEEEETERLGPITPGELAERLAELKALSLAGPGPDATIIACDQVAAFEGRAYGKPVTFETAVEQLLAKSGREQTLITALVVWQGGRTFRHTDITTLKFRTLTRAEVERYVHADQPLDCAGAFKLEERGITLFERVESADFTGITGLPLIALTTILRDLGYPLP
jgi:septum formation protein